MTTVRAHPMQRNGFPASGTAVKFVMWFHLGLKGQVYAAARTAVAVAEEATGPYTCPRSPRPYAGVWPMNATKEHKTAPIAVIEKDPAWEQKVAAGALLKRDFEGGQISRGMILFVDEDSTSGTARASGH